MIEDLLTRQNMSTAEEVIFTGGSAGGTAVILQLDHVASLMPAGVRTVVRHHLGERWTLSLGFHYLGNVQ
eukprot:COSAG06_NODE_829_length_12043_cov_8.656983_10_plen_70_part_00